MTDLSNKIIEHTQDKSFPLMHISRRGFLKGALAVGGALALAGCGDKVVEPNTVTVTETNTVTQTVTVVESAPSAPTETEIPNLVTKPSFIMPQYQDCVGCNICMVYCTLEHYNDLDLNKSNIQVYAYDIKGGMIDVPVLCMKCSDTPCLTSCPPKVAAITRDEVTGAILLDAEKCTGCGNCVTACAKDRTGCLRLDDETGAVYGMCDLCAGNPKCVTSCPEECLRLSQHNSGVPGQYWALNGEQLANNVWKLLYGCK